ncbi:MAG: hypothetical protein EBU96_07150 [Actinobacteria bacterium]|jgi:hypothetical protein|nr:hypothetical protein [Actinomycetota bacterium]
MGHDKHEMVKNIADVASVVATIGAFLEMFTPLFGLIGATWTVMRIAEMVTGKPFHELIKRKRSEQSEQEKP